MSALADIRVADFTTGVAGPFCAKMFADFGADVVKVEPPSGDPARAFGPFPGGDPDPDASGMFAYLNANKRGETLDLDTRDGRRRARDLCAASDVVVEDFPPGRIDEIGLGYDALRARNPSVILVSIAPFGQSGPWRDWQATDLTISAAAGLSYVNGAPDREPLKEPGEESLMHAGASAFLGAMAALAHRDMTGEGQRVDVSAQEAAASTFSPQFLGAMHSGGRERRGSTPLLPCKDGFVSLNVRHDATWEYMWLFFDAPDVAHDSRFVTAADRRRRADEIERLLLPYLARHTMAELFHALAPLRILIGMTVEAGDLPRDPHLRERGFFVEGVGGAAMPGAPFRMSATPWRMRRAAPKRGGGCDDA